MCADYVCVSLMVVCVGKGCVVGCAGLEQLPRPLPLPMGHAHCPMAPPPTAVRHTRHAQGYTLAILVDIRMQWAGCHDGDGDGDPMHAPYEPIRIRVSDASPSVRLPSSLPAVSAAAAADARHATSKQQSFGTIVTASAHATTKLEHGAAASATAPTGAARVARP